MAAAVCGMGFFLEGTFIDQNNPDTACGMGASQGGTESATTPSCSTGGGT
jgi:hypothetical protein